MKLYTRVIWKWTLNYWKIFYMQLIIKPIISWDLQITVPVQIFFEQTTNNLWKKAGGTKEAFIGAFYTFLLFIVLYQTHSPLKYSHNVGKCHFFIFVLSKFVNFPCHFSWRRTSQMTFKDQSAIYLKKGLDVFFASKIQNP